ncbi:hypothetical protein KP509_28G036600 [Ceratopteris richardii]|uniref:Uncharacterized protein n=1 Tax=Ceratopteris richardii TaxID=49495 RepID=A0A8T2RCH7_CERRI|nr:hypothetical protein KP509_28G036600 [Ceratopteris richardii]
MARSGSSSKFVPVNLNNSYGQTVSLSNGGAASSSSGLGRSRSFNNSYGGMVPLSRSSRITSSSSSSATGSRTSKLAVPRPVNLPSLRREHSGNDPTIALVGSLGSSGWSKQIADEGLDANPARSDIYKGDTVVRGNRAVVDRSSDFAERRSLSVGRQSIVSPPGAVEILPSSNLSASSSVTNAVVFRGEDFPTLQAAAIPSSPALPPRPSSRDSQYKQREKHHGSSLEHDASQQKQSVIRDDVPELNHGVNRQFQPAQPLQVQSRTVFPDQNDNVDRGSAYHRGPSPLIKLTHTSNWADDERETLSSVQMHESVQSEWTERNIGSQRQGSWSMDRSTDVDLRRPIARVGSSSRNELDFSLHNVHSSKSAFVKDDVRRDHRDVGRFQNDFVEKSDRSSHFPGRNDVLKRGWSFPAPELNNRDAKYASPMNRTDRDGFPNGRTYIRDGNNMRTEASAHDNLYRDSHPGSQHRMQESAFGKDVFLGKQGFPGSAMSPSSRVGGGPVLAYAGSDVSLPSKAKSGVTNKREKIVPGLYGHLHNDDPFLGDGISSRPNAFHVTQPKIKKENIKMEEYKDPARESFEAELERVEKMMELERQRAIEERERAIELARKEREEQERIAREEEELRLKLEEEARQAAYRAQREAEEAARKLEELRKAREEEKRMAEMEEERRKEAARRKLLELEERMAKRELEKRQEEVLLKDKSSSLRTGTRDSSVDLRNTAPKPSETGRDLQRKFISLSGKVDQIPQQVATKPPLSQGNAPLPSVPRPSSMAPHTKDGNAFMTGDRLSQTWRRDISSTGREAAAVQKGPPKALHLRMDNSYEQGTLEPQGSFRNPSEQRSPRRFSEIRASDDIDERDWWISDSKRSSYSTTIKPESPDPSDYPNYGRLRQSLPKQPRVLPPPPGNVITRKQASHPETDVGLRAYADGYGEAIGPFKEENRPSVGNDEVCPDNHDFSAVDVQLSEQQVESVLSDEVVISDAGSQFSEDTVEDMVVQPDEAQDLHSDAVSETYSDREVDEISDLSEAQESSEDLECQKPIDLEVSQGPENLDTTVSLDESATEMLDLEGKMDLEGEVSISGTDIETTVKCEEGTQSTDSALSEEICASMNVEVPMQDMSVSEQEEQSVILPEVKCKEAVKGVEDFSAQKEVQSHEMQSFSIQAPFLAVGTSDTTQLRYLEGVSSRQSLMQQFQQPFSFMAVPIPQSGRLNHAGASLPTYSSVQSLPSQQELPFHLQVGLLPSVPLMPNAIQIGSIQMPLHIHPQITHLNHIHGHQQAPVLQFGQIGPSLAVSQPMTMTHVPQSVMQIHSMPGQNNSVQQHQLQTEGPNDVGSMEHEHSESITNVEAIPIMSEGHQSVGKDSDETTQGAVGTIIQSVGVIEQSNDFPVIEQAVEMPVSDRDSKIEVKNVQKMEPDNKSEPIIADDTMMPDNSERYAGRPSRGSRRRGNPARHQGILGRGRGRFRARGGFHNSFQGSQFVAENRAEGAVKKTSRGKMYRRNYRRTEYRVRESAPFYDADMGVVDAVSGLSSSMEEVRESRGYRYIKRGQVSNSTIAGGNETKQFNRPAPQSSTEATRNMQLTTENVPATTSRTKSLLKKYEVENPEDAAFRTGVVCVFEQPGIETPNDKDDFIKVRSKRKLLRELREQREKDSRSKAQDAGAIEQIKKQQRSSAKTSGANNGLTGARVNKNVMRRPSTQKDIRSRALSSSYGSTATPLATSTNRNSNLSKPGQSSSASKVVIQQQQTESIASSANLNQTTEHLTTTAWGGQRSSQEVVSLTQIQLEEAMKPFRLDVPFTQSATSSEKKSTIPVETELVHSSLPSAEKAVPKVKASGPLSSLLAGEKIQFGAVTSPTRIPPDNCSEAATPIPELVQTSSSIDFSSNAAHISSHTSSFVSEFLDSHLDVPFAMNTDHRRKNNGYEQKVVDLEAEAAAEAAATAVAAAAMNSEDPIERHSDGLASDVNMGCSTITSGPNALSGKVQNNCASDNPMAVALPADLSIETPPSLFQGGSVNLPNSGVVLQSMQAGVPNFPSIDINPILREPVFNFGAREDASMASVDPGISGWQQRHVASPDSFYGATPFLNPAGLSNIQGHPHMLVYTNTYAPMGQFGQLGVSFMGTAYHPSGKQPDWTHIPAPSGSSGSLTANNGDLSSTSNGLIGSQHLNGSSNLILTQRAPVVGSSVMSIASAPNLFDMGFPAPFQVSQVDGLAQSHWSKAPAPPVHSVSVSGTAPALPMSRQADHSVQILPSRNHGNQSGLSSNPMDVRGTFHQLPVINSGSSGLFTPVDGRTQYLDAQGLGDSLAAGSLHGGNGSFSDAGHLTSRMQMEISSVGVPQIHQFSQNVQGYLASPNDQRSHRDIMPSSNYQEQNKNVPITVESQVKNSGRTGSPSLHPSSIQMSDQRTSKQGLPRDNMSGDWARGSQKKGVSRNTTSSERGSTTLPAKLKQIYVAKPAGESRKVGATCG